MSAPAFGSIGALFSGPSAAPAFAVPAGVAADDIVVIAFYLDFVGTAITSMPAGFQHATGSPLNVSPPPGSSHHQLVVLWKRATGADAGTYTVNLGSSVWVFGNALRYPGAIASGDPWEGANGAESGNVAVTATPPVSLTTLGPDRLLVHVATDWNGDGGTWSPPAGFSMRTTASPNTTNCMVSDKTQAVAGSTGSVSGSSTGAGRMGAWIGALIGTTGGSPTDPLTLGDSPSGLRWGSAYETAAIGLIVADSPQGLRLGSSGGSVVSIGLVASDGPSGIRLGGASETVTAGVVVADAPRGFRVGGAAEGITVGVGAGDTPSGFRLGAPKETASAALVVADSPAGFRVGRGASSGGAATLEADPAPGGYRFGSGREAGVTFAVVTADAPAGYRLGTPSQAFAFGVLTADSPNGFRAGSGASTVTVGSAGFTDTVRGYRLGSGFTDYDGLVDAQPPATPTIIAPVGRVHITAEVPRARITAAVERVRL